VPSLRRQQAEEGAESGGCNAQVVDVCTDERAIAGLPHRNKKYKIFVMSLQHKISRTANAPTTPPDETETAVAQALLDLENSVPDLKTELRPLQISAAREVDVRGGKKAIVVFVPVPQLKAFHKVQARCVLSCVSVLCRRPCCGAVTQPISIVCIRG
jgi:Ribosomal protein S7e